MASARMAAQRGCAWWVCAPLDSTVLTLEHQAELKYKEQDDTESGAEHDRGGRIPLAPPPRGHAECGEQQGDPATYHT